MPRAAWCSRCGAYQWVNADGTCANGHPAECLSAHHVVRVPGYPDDLPAPPADERESGDGRWLPVAVVAAALCALTLAVVVSVSAFRLLSSAEQIRSFATPPPARFAPGPDSAIEDPVDVSADETGPAQYDSPVPPSSPPETPVKVRKTTNAHVKAPALDAFIAEQYPGYRVEKRTSFPDQWGDGRLGVNYLLVNKRHPHFRVFVGLTTLKKGEDPYDSGLPYYFNPFGRIATDDMAFSANGERLYGFLSNGWQDKLVESFAEKMPPDGFAYQSSIDGADISVPIGVGAADAERAMGAPKSDPRYMGDATMPVVPGRDVLTVEIDPY